MQEDTTTTDCLVSLTVDPKKYYKVGSIYRVVYKTKNAGLEYVLPITRHLDNDLFIRAKKPNMTGFVPFVKFQGVHVLRTNELYTNSSVIYYCYVFEEMSLTIDMKKKRNYNNTGRFYLNWHIYDLLERIPPTPIAYSTTVDITDVMKRISILQNKGKQDRLVKAYLEQNVVTNNILKYEESL